MKYLKKLIYLAPYLFFACEYEINYSGQLENDKLVIATMLQEDSTISFPLMHSAQPGVFEGTTYEEYKKKSTKQYNKNPFVFDALINLYVNGDFKETAKKTSNSYNYRFDYIPKHNDMLSFEIQHKDYPTAYSQVNMNIITPQLDSFYCSIEERQGRKCEVIYIELNDDGNENYYMIEPYTFNFSRSYFSHPTIILESHSGVYYNNSIALSFGEEDIHFNYYGVFSNERFKGEIYKLKLCYETWSDENERGYRPVKISKIDRNTHNYLYSLGNYINSSSSMLNPVSIQNFITNGYGFIGCKKSIVKNLQ